MRWIRNRCVPLVLSGGNMAFWLCLRDLSGLFDRYPFLRCVYQMWVQVPAFVLLGATLMWAAYAFGAEKERKAWIRALCWALGFVLFQLAYNLALRRRVYVVNPWEQLVCMCAGVALCGLVLGRVKGAEAPAGDGSRVSWKPVSIYRSPLMGIAMLWVVLFHARMESMNYILPVDILTRLGNAGSDIFLFVSGLGIVYSLRKRSGVWDFYKRRMRRIYPEVAPSLGIYGLICVGVGEHGVPLLIANCLGVGFWVSAKGFNWYLSFLLLVYLVSPLMYRLLCGGEKRYRWSFVMLAASMLFLFLLYDVMHAMRVLIAFSRFPVFLFGMLAGFWLQEDASLSRGEYTSLLGLSLLFLLFAYLLDAFEMQPVIGSMWLCYCFAVPGLCLFLARLLSRVPDGRLMRFLAWTGENSLSIYVWNIILRRLCTMFLPTKGIAGILFWTVGVIASNFAIALLIQRWKRRIRARRVS